MYFANPVPGFIHPKGWVRPAGNTEFVITRTCADHQATKQGCALDLGNKRCGDPVYASAAGLVQPRPASFIVSGIVRIAHADGWRTDYSHMESITVKGGQTVALGQQIGVVGDAHDPSILNFAGCHLHYNILLNGAQQDPEPYMNAPVPTTGEDMLQGTLISRIINKKTSVLGNDTNFRAAPATGTTAILAKFASGTNFLPDFDVNGQKVGISTRWFAGFLSVNGVQTLGYLHESVVGPLTDAMATGHSDAALAAAASSAAAANEAKWEQWVATHP